MNIQDAKNEIENTLRMYLTRDECGCYVYPQVRQRPILLMGPPGVGKTAILEQIARECGVGLVSYTMTHHTRQSAVGLPKIIRENFGGQEVDTTEYTMSEIIASIYRCERESGKKEGILFLDEINCVSETLTPVMLQLLQNKTFGTHRVPEGWLIVAAGNPPAYNRSAREFDVVTLDRVRQISIEPDVDVWLSYASSRGLHGAILSFLKMKPDYFYQVRVSSDEKVFVTARGWEDLSWALKGWEKLGIQATESQIFQFLRDPKSAAEFAEYLEVWEKYGKDWDLRAVLEEADKTADRLAAEISCGSFEARFIAAALLLDQLSAEVRKVSQKENELGLLRKKVQDLEQSAVGPRNDIYDEIENFLASKEHALDVRKEHGLLEPDAELQERRALQSLKRMETELKLAHVNSLEDAKSLMEKRLSEDRTALERQEEAVRSEIIRGTAFAEKALGKDTPELYYLTSGLKRLLEEGELR